ncbi:MAG TPA: dihydrodipicolinate synthase family protein [Burkholderiales bacterium]|nr:dihydrodipicolinate synthase family protein [Burkholderiales bacterium]
MAMYNPGLVHTPVTPFKADHSVDYDAYAKLIEFHLKNGADALAVTMHAGESVSLSDIEQRKMMTFAIKQVKGRVPVIAHASDSGTQIAADRARFAQDAGAQAIVSTTPYYWTPPPGMVLEHLAMIGKAVTIPYLIFFTPHEMGVTKISTGQVLTLIERLPNFAGVVDASRDWQFMINIITAASRVRPDFQIMSATDYMVSSGAIGAKTMFSPLAGVAPRLIRQLYDLCRQDQYFEACKAQEAVAALYQAVKAPGLCGLKGAVGLMGRDCGNVRPPNTLLGAAEHDRLAAGLSALSAMAAEPRGW